MLDSSKGMCIQSLQRSNRCWRLRTQMRPGISQGQSLFFFFLSNASHKALKLLKLIKQFYVNKVTFSMFELFCRQIALNPILQNHKIMPKLSNRCFLILYHLMFSVDDNDFDGMTFLCSFTTLSNQLRKYLIFFQRFVIFFKFINVISFCISSKNKLNQFQQLFRYLMKSQQNKRKLSFRTALTSYAFVTCSVSMANPLDLIRVRLQVAPQLIQREVLKQPYKGIKDCVLKIKKEEGLKAFWKGNLSNILRILPSQSLIFYLKEFLHKKIHYGHTYTKKQHVILNGTIGLFSSLIVQYTLYPMEFIRQRLAVRTDDKGIGIWHQLKKTVKQNGISRLYKGVIIFISGSILFRGTYFGLYDSLKITTDNVMIRWFYSYMSMFIAIMIPYPGDTVRRRMLASKQKYSGFLDCTRQIIRKQGLFSLFAGWKMILLQSITSSFFFYTYDKLFTNYEQACI